MRRIFFAVILVVACATVATADPREDADSAFQRGDYAQAVELWRPLAAQGDAGAQFHLGAMYAQGKGVLQDYQEALKWFRKAAEQRDAEAQVSLGLMYDAGMGVPQDSIRAHMWYSLGAVALSGDEGKKAMKLRDDVASLMTAAQIEKAQEMARRCQGTKFKECD